MHFQLVDRPVQPGSPNSAINLGGTATKPITYRVAIVNASRSIADEKVLRVVDAVRKQITGDFAPRWGISADIGFIRRGDPTPEDAWPLLILDGASDNPNMISYHFVNDLGHPSAKIFPDMYTTDNGYGTQWSLSVSHELINMLTEPRANLVVAKYKKMDPPRARHSTRMSPRTHVAEQAQSTE